MLSRDRRHSHIYTQLSLLGMWHWEVAVAKNAKEAGRVVKGFIPSRNWDFIMKAPNVC